jgi:hypothetical protein
MVAASEASVANSSRGDCHIVRDGFQYLIVVDRQIRIECYGARIATGWNRGA